MRIRKAGNEELVNKRKRITVVITGIVIIASLSLLLASKEVAAVSMTVPYSMVAVSDPDLDGLPATGNWADAVTAVIPLENGEASSYGSATMHAKHDGTFYYFRMDGQIDVTWTSATGNHFWLGFQISPTGTSHHGNGAWDGAFFGLWDGTDYTPMPSYPPPVVDTNGFDKPPIKDTTQNALGRMRYSGSAAPYDFTAEWKMPLNSGDADDLTYTADGATSYNFYATTDSNNGGSSGGSIDHKKATNLNTMTFEAPSTPNNPPTADLTSPDGGEVYSGGTPHLVWWNMSDTETATASLRVWLNYSTNGGSTFSPIAGVQGATGFSTPSSYSWTLPTVSTVQARVRATVADAAGAKATDTSLANFAIDSTAPTVTGSVPSNGATGVSPATQVDVTFSEPMNQASAQQAFSLMRTDTSAYVPGAFGWVANTLRFTPSGQLAQGIQYRTQVNVTAKDTSRPGNPLSSVFTALFTTVDSSPPSISSVTADPSPQETGLPVNISAVVTDNISVAEAWIEVHGPGGPLIGNYTALYDTGPGRYYWTNAYSEPGTHTFRMSARDVAGNWAASPGNFQVVDTQPPVISHTPVTQALRGSPFTITATVTDSVVVSDVRVDYMDVLGSPFNVSMVLNGTVYEYEVPAQPQLGSLVYFVWAVDSSSNVARTPDYTVNIVSSDMVPPVISNVAAQPPVQNSTYTVNVSATVTDNLGVRSVRVVVTDPLMQVMGNFTMLRLGVSSTFYFARTYSELGTYNFLIWATDTASNNASAPGTFVIVDLMPPVFQQVTVTPQVQEVNQPVNISATVSDNMGVAGVQIVILDPLGSTVLDAPMVGGPSVFWNEGTYPSTGNYTFTLTATDMNSNTADYNGGFSIETIPPTFQQVTVTPPIQEVGQPVNITATVTDNTGVADVHILILDPLGSTVHDAPMGGGPNIFWDERAHVAAGNYTFTLTATDLDANTAVYDGGFRIQSSPPAFQLVTVTPPVQDIGQPTNISATVTDNTGIAGVRVLAKDPGGGTALDAAMSGGPNLFWAEEIFTPLGDFTFTLTATDLDGNTATHDDGFSIVDTQPPVAGVGPDVNIWTGTSVTLDGSSSTDNWQISSYTWTFVYNGSDITLAGEVTSYTFFTVGQYNVTLTVEDTAGLQGTATMKVTVITDSTAPPPPRNLDAVAEGRSCIRLTWEASSAPDLSGYRIYRWNDSRNGFDLIAEVDGNTTTYLDCGLEDDKVYSYWVTAFDDDDNSSPPSPMANGRTEAVEAQADSLEPLLLSIILMLAVLVIIFAALWTRNRSKEKTPPEEEPKFRELGKE